jgi:enediyne biosynthesis protein E4
MVLWLIFKLLNGSMSLRITLLIVSVFSECGVLLAQKDPMFQQLPPAKTGVTFRNMLKESPQSNVLTYEYFYNGGGTSIGDINNDGLEDLYFTANMGANKLYLNQ